MRRLFRDKQPSKRYLLHEYIMLTYGGDQEDYSEALADEHKGEWLKTMQEEMESSHKNHTYDMVKLPKGKKALSNKWVFRKKVE